MNKALERQSVSTALSKTVDTDIAKWLVFPRIITDPTESIRCRDIVIVISLFFIPVQKNILDDTLFVIVPRECVEVPKPERILASVGETKVEECEKKPDRCFWSEGWATSRSYMQLGICFYKKGNRANPLVTIFPHFRPRVIP